MALDRQNIERKDFPVGRRGYDPQEVDAHLAALADEVEELKRSSRRRTETIAATASEQVRAMVEAAETSASEIHRKAEVQAREIRVDAGTDAKATRDPASVQGPEYVHKVSESTTVMLQRIEAMASELSALVDSLRAGGNRLSADLELLEKSLDKVRDAIAPGAPFEPEPPVPSETPGDPPAGTTSGTDAALPPVGPGPGSNGGEDADSARLIALNMALNGSSREETERYLAENFRLPDRHGLLDEVYASVER